MAVRGTINEEMTVAGGREPIRERNILELNELLKEHVYPFERLTPELQRMLYPARSQQSSKTILQNRMDALPQIIRDFFQSWNKLQSAIELVENAPAKELSACLSDMNAARVEMDNLMQTHLQLFLAEFAGQKR
jgi:hypothetical protein